MHALGRHSPSEASGARHVELPEAGHSPYFETPDAFNPVVAEFLATHVY